MKTKTRETYNCDHCNKLYLVKHAATKHEDLCKKSPDNRRACFGCSHLTKEEASATGYFYDGSEYSRSLNLLWCNARSVFVFPPQAEKKGNAWEVDDHENIAMPKECELRQEAYPFQTDDFNL